MSEAAVLNACLAYLRDVGAVAVRVNSGAIRIHEEGQRERMVRLARPGTSDIIACWRGRFLAVECKFGKNDTTAKQDRFLADVREAGGIALVVWGVDELKEALSVIEQMVEAK